jgi:hypothetical protein
MTIIGSFLAFAPYRPAAAGDVNKIADRGKPSQRRMSNV